ncbi:class I SAM-dependent methyltransferase [Pseudocnuella soli]|uniref:class I SAM-dependent methyltransferase n=1 Tax=Pseudocnuella soli TaxID=2502779 RepID=UPI00105021B1|nr:class I SAM-dependent methyltransferase [Pseudocnuella soli]
MKSILSKIPYLRYAYFYRENCAQRPGHYYSPVVDLADLSARKETIWKKGKKLPGIDLNTAGQENVLDQIVAHSQKIPFSDNKTQQYRYYYNNKTYEHADGWVLFGMLNAFRPRRIIEVGSGFSSALILDTKDEFLDYPIDLTFIEPNPQDRLTGLLKKDDYKNTTIIKDIVQHVPPETFQQLEANDILLIDNSHVSKTGSDVNYLMTEILPVLNKGVIVHIHDIFYPFEYPEEWLFEHRLNWNELYCVHNFLLFNNAFKIIFFADFIQQEYSAVLQEKVPLFFKGRPGSLWIQRV